MRELPAAAQQPLDDCVLAGWIGPGGAFAQLVFDGWIHTLELHEAAAGVEDAFSDLVLDRDAVLAQLGSLDAHCVHAGVRAAATLSDPALAAALAPLRHHPDEAVRHEAAAALQRLLPVLLDAGRRWFEEQMRVRGGAQPLWDVAGPAWLRRQTLRWLLHDFGAPTPGVEATLRAALVDPDWEVRAGAMIGAVRLRLRSLGGLVEHCVLPANSRNGPDAADRALLRALRQVGCALLAGRVPPAPSADDAPARQALRRLARWLSESEVPLDDPAGRLMVGLTLPIHAGSASRALPSGVTDDGFGPQVGGRRLVAVPPAPLIAGFCIARDPVDGGDAPLQLDRVAAQAWCRQHSHGQVRWRLATVDEWRWAAGGSDCRRYPWGNGAQEDGPVTPGPWGTWGHGAAAEWASGPDGGPVACGPLIGAVRPVELATLRPVVG